VIEIDAPYFGDEPPRGPACSLDHLWEHEVVEIFFVGEGDRYLEVEFSPHGHHLLLLLEGVRRRVARIEELDFRARIEGSRWEGIAVIPAGLLPAGLATVNAFSIHGPAHARVHAAWRPVPGLAPDFHRLAAFGPIEPALSALLHA
jgi:hypothetical protein